MESKSSKKSAVTGAVLLPLYQRNGADVPTGEHVRSVSGIPKSMAVSEANPLLCAKSAARIMNVSHQTLAQWRSNRKVDIPYVRIGRKVMYRRCDLDAFIAANVQLGFNDSRGV